MSKLSPAAQAVLDAVKAICPAPADEIAAAALRAAADQLGQELEFYDARMIAAEDLLAVANELEAQ